MVRIRKKNMHFQIILLKKKLHLLVNQHLDDLTNSQVVKTSKSLDRLIDEYIKLEQLSLQKNCYNRNISEKL